MYVVGLDIGYSNVKIAAGPRGDLPRLILRPAGAAPRERLGERIGAEEGAGSATGATADRPVPVDLDGVPWAAAIEPERFEDWQRPLHEDYPATPSYRALALAALRLTGQCAIDLVVTGLPVAQAGEVRRRERLKRLLTGRHGSGEASLEVGEVRVVPQPIGAYLDLVYTATDEEILERIETGTVIVLDAGFYSFDWALVVKGELRRSASGTSLEAMSVLLERAAQEAVAEAGGKPQPLGLEAALRAGRSHVLQAGHRLSVPSLLGRAAGPVCAVALESLRRSLRRESASVDLVLIAGGGGSYYVRAAAGLFPGATVVVAADPIAANARGFHRYAG
jgi:plasmid segregation protein ParM